jgi:hypothetical protein
VKHKESPDIIGAIGNVRLAVVMMVRMKVILGQSDDEDHGANRGHEKEQS